MKLSLPLFLIALLLVLSSCESHVVFKKHEFLGEYNVKWYPKDKKTYEVVLEEDLPQGFAFVEIRHGYQISVDELPITLHYQSADGKVQEKKEAAFVFRQGGKLVGSGMGDTFDTKQQFADLNLQAGTYTFTIETTSADEFISPISEIGLVIEKTKN
jgi:gliding motility-associated lipoprotein GldH